MGDIAAHMPIRLDQRFYPVEHLIECPRQTSEIVILQRLGDSSAEVSSYNFLRGLRREGSVVTRVGVRVETGVDVNRVTPPSSRGGSRRPTPAM